MTLLMQNLHNEKTSQTPFWFMRQAGRYLPEYKKIRSGFPDFLSFCYTPDAACEVTLQPITRFDMDAAILFSDILVIPDALGQSVRFEQGEGPKLDPITHIKDILRLSPEGVLDKLAPVFTAIRLIRKELSPDKSLIGFAGSPWTVACYMIEGKGSKDFATTRGFAYGQPEAFAQLIDILVESTSRYLIAQVEAGVNVLQLFDSWAGILPESEFHRWVINPTTRIVANVKAAHPDIPIIGFARSAAPQIIDYENQTGVTAMAMDTAVCLDWAKAHLHKPLQGNLDPILLASDEKKAVKETLRILEAMKDRSFIFNLGHGIVPHTPIAHVEAVVATIKGFRA